MTIDPNPAPVKPPSAEAEAKAALLRFLRINGGLKSSTAIVLELSMSKQLNRCDLVTISNGLHCYEIKTKRDTLVRLDRQLEAYAKSADHVTVVAATRHINAIMSRIPDFIGILEIVKFGKYPQIREIRAAKPSPVWSADAALDLLPASEIRVRLLNNAVARRRADLLKLIENSDPLEIRLAVVQFLKARYLPTTQKFLTDVGRRAIRADDLTGLRIWSARSGSLDRPRRSDFSIGEDQETYLAIGDSFGPVPEDVRQLLRG